MLENDQLASTLDRAAPACEAWIWLLVYGQRGAQSGREQAQAYWTANRSGRRALVCWRVAAAVVAAISCWVAAEKGRSGTQRQRSTAVTLFAALEFPTTTSHPNILLVDAAKCLAGLTRGYAVLGHQADPAVASRHLVLCEDRPIEAVARRGTPRTQTWTRKIKLIKCSAPQMNVLHNSQVLYSSGRGRPAGRAGGSPV